MKNQKQITMLKRSISSWPSVLGRDGPMSNAYRLAIQYINEGRPITAVEVNKVLAFSGISISQDMLNKILSRPRLDFSDLDSSTIKTEKFLQSIGTVRGKVQVTHVPSGSTAIYPSFRKAALSFAPDYITTGPTLKALAKDGKLFKGEFKITILNNK